MVEPIASWRGNVIAPLGVVKQPGSIDDLRDTLLLPRPAAAASLPVLRVVVTGMVFLFGLTGTIAAERAVRQVRTPADAEGRVVALRRASARAPLPISDDAVDGSLADYVFTPARALKRTPVGSIGHVLGNDAGSTLLCAPGRFVGAPVVLTGRRHRRLRSVDVAT